MELCQGGDENQSHNDDEDEIFDGHVDSEHDNCGEKKVVLRLVMKRR
jgi:hypothetical protein